MDEDCSNITLFDPSKFHFKEKVRLTGSDWTKISIYIVLIVCGLVGNISVILTVGLNRFLRTTINVYIANLAVADLMICLCCMIKECIQIITYPMYVLGPFLCKFNNFAQMTSLTCSVFTLAAISCDRFVAILFPLHARVTKQRTSLVISGIWLSSALVGVPYLLVMRQFSRKWINYEEKICGEIWPVEIIYDPYKKRCVHYSLLRVIYHTFATVVLFFLPVLIMITAYSLILWKIWVSKAPGELTAANTNMQERAKKKVIKMVTVVLVVFIICWLPLQVLILYDQFFKHSAALPQWLASKMWLVHLTAYTNSVLNPLIYGGYNETFREGLCLILKGQCRRHGGPSSSQKSRLSHTTAIAINRAKAGNGTKTESQKSNIEMKEVIARNNGDASPVDKGLSASRDVTDPIYV